MNIFFPTRIDVKDEGYAEDRIVRCGDCDKIIAYFEWWGDLRTEGYLDSDMIDTCWNFTKVYCPDCYPKRNDKYVKMFEEIGK